VKVRSGSISRVGWEQSHHPVAALEIRPLAAHIKLTENCQAKCISCNYWQTRWQDGINTDRAIALVMNLGLGVRSLRFTGGEPLLRTDFFQILDKSNTSPFPEHHHPNQRPAAQEASQGNEHSPITSVAVSIDGLKETNDLIRGIRGYFDLAMEGIKLLRNKKVKIFGDAESNLRQGAQRLPILLARRVLSWSPISSRAACISPRMRISDAMWPQRGDVQEIETVLRNKLKRPDYEVDYITRYYNNDETLEEPPCVLGYLQVFVISNGDVLTGCYPLKPVGNILKDSLENILASDEYAQQAQAMIRRECPGCTCGVESSLAMKHAVRPLFFT